MITKLLRLNIQSRVHPSYLFFLDTSCLRRGRRGIGGFYLAHDHGLDFICGFVAPVFPAHLRRSTRLFVRKSLAQVAQTAIPALRERGYNNN